MKEWPRLFISHYKAIGIVGPRASCDAPGPTIKNKVPLDFILFIVSSHLLVSFHFLPDIH